MSRLFPRMNKAREYSEHAQECRVLARKAQSEDMRIQFLNMADAWDRLAAVRTRLVIEQRELENS
jgi:hypothetical protein